ncbi:DUF1642 domain-containing protein [Streptococcus parauberis]|uniref:DUF1642 domain-containing protein n=1 Tax=Streptococcus parauberis KRS-02083 TaxID=1207545 RepID=A0ABN0ITS1_9STRE|nr:DUF1642 domain-containing protein [Streptococcus parauberis]EMG26260.1 hypothetical protein SPJ1_0222 [Streptococcus parauberis KRS-02083]QBX18107.1 hypothetical protein Javan393_0027 [Streptococcus phage Javan393]WEM65805.1 DUF1642 domain-containing protein [Streptococcus parauberis]WOF47685.1 DUF1642 domain-containing protein [Streptococcus parauberis]
MKIEEAKIRFEEIETYTHGFYDDVLIKKCDAKVLLDQLDQPKPVVPQCVIDWVNDSRESDYFFEEWFDRDYQPKEVRKWLNLENKRQADINALALVTLIVNGPDAVTVEKEKLYTVEIPNPNTPAITVLARSIVGDVVMCNEFDTCWKNNSRYQLTEQEIRKDFDWAWQFAKEVTE